jgi:hypothetical protein
MIQILTLIPLRHSNQDCSMCNVNTLWCSSAVRGFASCSYMGNR